MKKYSQGKKGGTRKIANIPKNDICRDPQHDPLKHMVYEPGVYEHTCPSCGHVVTFTIPNPPSL